MTTKSVLFALLRAAISAEEMNESVVAACTAEMLSAVYELANRHDVVHLVGYVLDKAKLPDYEVLERFKTAKTQAIYRYLRQDYEFRRICETFERKEIPFIPLKGSVLRNYYPEPWMRTSCDIDILVKEDQLENAVVILAKMLRYEVGEKGSHDISLFSSTGVHLELHYDTVRRLLASDHRREVLVQIWADAQPVTADRYESVIPDEMFYFYHMAHMAKHFGNGGCGIRSVLDTWILNHRLDSNREKREALLEQGGLLAFAQAIEKLSECWFSQRQPDAVTEQLSDYILRGGLFGSKENRAAFGQAKAGGKWRYLLTRRIFIPYDFLKAEYPVLEKHKWLTPVYQIVRWIRMLRSGRAGIHMAEMVSNLSTEDRERSATEALLRQLELR